MQITIIKLVNYKKWTETLGYDREHIIQEIQGKLHGIVAKEFARYGAFAHPLRYDYMIAFTNGLNINEHKEILNELRKISPVPIVMSIAVSETVIKAEQIASKICNCENKGNEIITHGEIPDLSKLCIIHADLENSTKLFQNHSTYETYLYVMSILQEFTEIVRSMYGLSLYIGGDNMLGITTPEYLDLNLLRKFSKKYRIRIGIGIDVKAREAIKKATYTLDKLRKENSITVSIMY